MNEWLTDENDLPDDEGMYLVTREDANGNRQVDYCQYYRGNWANGYLNGKVIAWMSLPEPFGD